MNDEPVPLASPSQETFTVSENPRGSSWVTVGILALLPGAGLLALSAYDAIMFASTKGFKDYPIDITNLLQFLGVTFLYCLPSIICIIRGLWLGKYARTKAQ